MVFQSTMQEEKESAGVLQKNFNSEFASAMASIHKMKKSKIYDLAYIEKLRMKADIILIMFEHNLNHPNLRY